MSQKAVFVKIDNNIVPEIFSCVPDYDDAIQICRDYADKFKLYEGGVYELEYEWYDIGEGESGMDTFVEEERLLELYTHPFLEFGKLTLLGHEIDRIDSGSFSISAYELDDMNELDDGLD